nr:sigma-70 family RNA polymerase sigma factor [Sulfobacillus harzensis]
MHRVATGEWDALKELYQRFSPGVYQLARRRLNDDRMAEDVVQEVFMRIWHHASKWDPDRGSVDTWILVMTRHVVYDHLRTIPPGGLDVVGKAISEQFADPDDGISDVLEADALRHLLQGLSPEQRQVIRLVYVEGMTTKAVAERLNIPLGTVKSRLRLALDHLRRELEKEAHSDGAL